MGKVGAPKRKATDKKADLKKAVTKDVDDVVEKIFSLSDADKSGAIEFGEFLIHHRHIMSSTEFAGAAEMDDAKLEARFREHDHDNSQTLDKEEFRCYMDGVFSILGKRKFLDVCEALIQETAEKLQVAKSAHDAATSERLLEKARAVHWFLPDIEQTAFQLLGQRADPNYRDTTGTTTLLYTADKAHDSFIGELLRLRADPALHNKDLDCCAFRAARARHVDVLRLLLLPEARPATAARPGTGATSVHEKLKTSQELVQKMSTLTAADASALLKKGADINYRDDSGWTSLTAAVFWGKAETLDVILKTQTQHAKGSAKLHVDAMNGKGRAALHIAARKGRDEMICTLSRARCDVDMQDADGWTPLHHAAFNNQSDCIVKLIDCGANLQIQGLMGMTPHMLTKMPTSSGKLTEKAMKLLEPPESISWAKAITLVLKDEKLSVFGKLEAMLEFPGVHQIPKNLRLYEQFFDVRHGPNKVRLQKIWEALVEPIMRRMLTGQCDLEQLGSEKAADVQADRAREVEVRQKDQRAFLKQWLLDQKGPRPCEDWKHENSEAYKEDMQRVLDEELNKFRAKLDDVYAKMQEMRQGGVLVGRAEEEVLNPKFTSQLQAHSIPLWLQQLDPAGAFEALRMVGALARDGGQSREDDDAVLLFTDLLTNNVDFITGKTFWRNVYRLWLSSYAQMVDREFQRKVQALVEKFNAAHQDDEGMQAVYHGVAPKAYDRIKVKEATFGDCKSESYEARTLAGKALDIVRCSVTVREPRAALALIDDVFEPLKLKENNLECFRIQNRFSKKYSCDKLMGYRNIEMNLLFDAGQRPTACGRPGLTMHMRIIGEVQIVLQDFLNVRKQRHLLFKAARGEFEWRADADEMKRSHTLVDDD